MNNKTHWLWIYLSHFIIAQSLLSTPNPTEVKQAFEQLNTLYTNNDQNDSFYVFAREDLNKIVAWFKVEQNVACFEQFETTVREIFLRGIADPYFKHQGQLRTYLPWRLLQVVPEIYLRSLLDNPANLSLIFSQENYLDCIDSLLYVITKEPNAKNLDILFCQWSIGNFDRFIKTLEYYFCQQIQILIKSGLNHPNLRPLKLKILAWVKSNFLLTPLQNPDKIEYLFAWLYLDPKSFHHEVEEHLEQVYNTIEHHFSRTTICVYSNLSYWATEFPGQFSYICQRLSGEKNLAKLYQTKCFASWQKWIKNQAKAILWCKTRARHSTTHRKTGGKNKWRKVRSRRLSITLAPTKMELDEELT